MNLTPEKLACLRLIRTNHVGPVTFQKLLERCGNAQDALAQLPELCRQYKRKLLTPPSVTQLEPELKAMEKLGANYLFLGQKNYPELLSHIADAPPVLTVLGATEILQQPQIAIVGNRNASASGRKITHQLAADLVNNNFVITSGLARGVDTAAHQGALAAKGKTVAVMASGLGHIYPPENAPLYQQILEQGGCIISENPAYTTPTNQHFPRRNRIISGLSMAVVVTEASRHSGSLITARFAGEHGRDVFAMPGSPADPRAAGPNHLIKQGAAMLETAADILETLNPIQFRPTPSVAYTRENFTPQLSDLFQENPHTEEPEPAPSEELLAQVTETPEMQLLDLLSATPTHVDEILRQSNLPANQALVLITQLELSGQISRHAGGKISRMF